ncbi:sugar transferase [Enterovibrio baiacu]|uniref:sugar transferase n=1 Tax=Enterovibrio baiacu TaxID=2491023 RepID=UPI003D137355
MKNTVNVYCPSDYENLVVEILEKLNISYTINKNEFDTFRNQIVCHFMSSALEKDTHDLLIKATKYGAKVEPLSEYLSKKVGYIELELLHPDYFLQNKSFSILRRKHHEIPKRLLDLTMVALLAPIAIPVGLITAVAIKLESEGDVFFKQERVGRYNQPFNVIKFRSMGMDAEKNGAQWASKNDMRVTRVGKFIRKTRIDELPQLINVMKGEMSMVGARPEREVFIQDLEKEIPYYRFRHAAHVGITGLAQVSYPYGESLEDAKWKHRYDVHYIKNQSLILDLKILAKTMKVVLFGMGQ